MNADAEKENRKETNSMLLKKDFTASVVFEED